MKKRVKFLTMIICLSGLLGFNMAVVMAETELIDEDALFSDDQIIEEKKTNDDVDLELIQQRLGISGEVDAKTTYLKNSSMGNWLGIAISDDHLLYHRLTADLVFDWRINETFRSFLSMEGSWYRYSEGISTLASEEKEDEDLMVKEFFADANWHNQVYVRAGKQVLQWGRSYFWNPTDLINVDQKDFFDLDKTREGTKGIRVHIPSGVKRNLYLFAGMDDVDETEDISLAGKYEVLVKNTEMSFSAWYKDGNRPVFGYDASGRMGKYNWWGEISLSDGDNNDKMFLDDEGNVYLGKEDGWIPRLSLGFTRYFNHGEIADRISLTGEFYYNDAGYDENILEKINNNELKVLYLSQVYQAFMNSKYYAAVFTTIQQFIQPQLTLGINSITNLVDYSTILSTRLNYKPTLKNICYYLTLTNYLGKENTEATLMGYSYNVALGVQLQF